VTAALVAGCPRDKGTSTTVAVNDQTPPAATSTTTDNTTTPPAGDTKVDVNVNQGDKSADADKGADANANGGTDQNGNATPPATNPPADNNPPADANPPEDKKPADETKEDVNVTNVILETSKGNIALAVHADWAPIGAAHFLELVNAGYYDGAPWFRVIPGFVAQCGLAADPKVTAQWKDKTIQDEPVKQGNLRGMVAFGKSGAPNSRSTHIFINLVDNSAGLDAQGFSCFAEVTSGMDVADKLKHCEIQDQDALGKQGIALFRKMVPDGDVITKAYVKK